MDKESPLDAQQIRPTAAGLAGDAQRVHGADADKQDSASYDALADSPADSRVKPGHLLRAAGGTGQPGSIRWRTCC